MKLKILSWNIWFDGDLKAVNDFLENSDADIIGLQEVMQINDVIQISKRLREKLGYEFVYSPAFQIQKDGKAVDVGIAIFSKFPILKSKTYNLSKTNNRIAIKADVKVNNKTLHIFSTHLLHTHQLPSQIQEEQADNLIKILPYENTILMGDFNALPDSNAVKKISSVIKNTDENLLPTWSVYKEGCKGCKLQGVIYKLDNIFVTKNLNTHTFQIEDSKASDHLPISVEIDL